jgi:hypothetical protein
MESNATETRIPCSRSTRDLVRSLKRGGESYDDLLEKMAKQYDPTIAEVSDGAT